MVRVQSHVVASGVAGLEARDFLVVVIVELNLAGRRAGGNVDGLGAVWMGGGGVDGHVTVDTRAGRGEG